MIGQIVNTLRTKFSAWDAKLDAFFARDIERLDKLIAKQEKAMRERKELEKKYEGKAMPKEHWDYIERIGRVLSGHGDSLPFTTGDRICAYFFIFVGGTALVFFVIIWMLAGLAAFYGL